MRESERERERERGRETYFFNLNLHFRVTKAYFVQRSNLLSTINKIQARLGELNIVAGRDCQL